MIDGVGDADMVDVSEVPTLVELLAETPAGPELSRLLASVDRSGLDCGGLLRLAQARQRQLAYEEAQLLADLHAVGRSLPDEEGLQDEPYQWAGIETAMALRWTRGRAGAQLALAGEVIDRLPQLHAALAAGRLDIPKVLVFTTLLERVDTELANALIDKLIDKAEDWTTGQLRQRLRRLLMAADPAAAAKKARRGIKDRRVISWLDDDTYLAHLSGQGLPPHRVAAVMERLDAVAAAARAAGDERNRDQIRADVFLDLLTGEGIAAGGPITDATLGLPEPPDTVTNNPHTTAANAAAYEAAYTPPPDTPPPAAHDNNHETEDELPEPATPATDPDGGLQPDPVWTLDPPPPADVRDPGDADAQTAQAAWLADFHKLPATRPATWCPLCGHTTGTPTSPAPMPGPRRGIVEIIATTETLLGLADLPAEITGMGPVTADIARHVINDMNNAQWRYSVYDPMQRLLHHGTTTQRPTNNNNPSDVNEIDRDPHRFPTTNQTTWIKTRDRTCVAPGCQRTARQCDIDHTQNWIHGGPTTHCNLELLCRAHHLFKHATGSELTQPRPGTFRWRTPAGLQYDTTSHPPLLLNTNQLTDLPKPPNPDTHLVPADHPDHLPDPVAVSVATSGRQNGDGR